MAPPEPCYLKHSEPNNTRYETEIREPGKPPERIVCCRDCGTAIYQRAETQLPRDADQERLQRMEQAIKNPLVEMPKPARLPDPPRLERSIGLEPPGYGPSL